ncbi:MAG: hypothetical protein SVW57_00815 [Thermodesulfobacteriota bacterium]|nr:hypothetical protein [Thermodesulfobacteriota bacterium]
MENQDVCIVKVHDYITRKIEIGRHINRFQHESDLEGLLKDLPIHVGQGAMKGIIFQNETAVELGNPAKGSVAFTIWTKTPGYVRNGEITLIGPNLTDTCEESLPFGQIILLASPSINERHIFSLDNVQFISDHIEGYMVRSAPRRVWSRVSKDNIQKGFSFEILGKALIALCKMQIFPELEVEVLFVTSNKEDVMELELIGDQVRENTAKVKKAVLDGWRGEDCEGLDCDSCIDKEVCDELRELLVMKRRERR